MPVAVLIGPPGAGKTTVGGLLAERLSVRFHDSDAVIEASAGMTVSDIFVTEGEPAFRRREHDAVLALLRDPDFADDVISLGGGSVLDPDVRTELAGHTVVLLTVALPDAAQRVGFNRDRPLLLGNPRARWQELLNQRLPIYREVADREVATDGRTPDEVAAEVAAVLQGAR